MNAFDADVLIYASSPRHPLSRGLRALFSGDPEGHLGQYVGVGSVLLLPEVLSKPLREHASRQLRALADVRARRDLRPVDPAVARLATALAARYGLRAAEAVHLATAVNVGADRFITNNRRDVPESITEIAITYPGGLDPTGEPDG